LWIIFDWLVVVDCRKRVFCRLYPDYLLWRDFAYEYEHERLAIDLINGSPLLRSWVDDPAATPAQLDAPSQSDESAWAAARREFLLY